MSGAGTATVGPVERAFAAVLDGPLGRAPIAALDHLRRRWLRALGGLARPQVRDRELRVAAMFSLMIVTALVGSVWLLLLGPLLWGVPHLVADLRYMLLETGYHRRRGLALLGGATLGWIALGDPPPPRGSAPRSPSRRLALTRGASAPRSRRSAIDAATWARAGAPGRRAA